MSPHRLKSVVEVGKVRVVVAGGVDGQGLTGGVGVKMWTLSIWSETSGVWVFKEEVVGIVLCGDVIVPRVRVIRGGPVIKL
eukprot:3653864-Karenia_brevis.AAC.1